MSFAITGLASPFKFSADGTVNLKTEIEYIKQTIRDAVLYAPEQTFGNSPTTYNPSEWKGLTPQLFELNVNDVADASGTIMEESLTAYLKRKYSDYISEVQVRANAVQKEVRLVVQYTIRRNNQKVTEQFSSEDSQ